MIFPRITKKNDSFTVSRFSFICLPNLSFFQFLSSLFNLWKTYVRSRRLQNRNTITKSATEKNEEFLILRKKVIKRGEKNLFTTRIAFANFHFFFHHQVKGKMYVMWQSHCCRLVKIEANLDDKIKFSSLFLSLRRQATTRSEKCEVKI